jgi:peptidoglycan/xylan/chitin deacetylase (PgdA/CDA1 family)
LRPDEFLRILDGASPPVGDCVLLTFDDGFADNSECAAPLLEASRLEAVMFVATGYVDGIVEPYEYLLARHVAEAAGHSQGKDQGAVSEEYESRRRALKQMPTAERERAWAEIRSGINGIESPGFCTWEQLRCLQARSVFSIESHGCRHGVMSSLPSGELRRECSGSRE